MPPKKDKFKIHIDLEFFKNFILNLKNYERDTRKYVYFYYFRDPANNGLLLGCLRQLAEDNKHEYLFFFLMDYLTKNATEIPRFREMIPDNIVSKECVLNTLKRGNLNEIFIIVYLNWIVRILSKDELRIILADPEIKFIENFVLALGLNKITEYFQILPSRFEDDVEKYEKEVKLEFEKHYFDDEGNGKEGIFRYFTFHDKFDHYQVKAYKNEFCDFLKQYYPRLFENTLFKLLKHGNDEIIEGLIDHSLLEYLPIKRVIKLLELKPERLEKLYYMFRKLLFEVDHETMLRDFFYGEQGRFFIELGKSFTPILKDVLDNILSQNKRYDYVYFKNLEWPTYDGIFTSEKANVSDPDKYKKLDEWA